MIPKECKRLAEADFPLAQVSKYAAREKSIRHGHPSTLHIWWARRPLASCRAILMALLLPDPCDVSCPETFREKARKLLLSMRARPSGWNKTVKTNEGLRQVLMEFIGEFSNWDKATNEEFLKTGRHLIEAAHGERKPVIVDPFAGGGSIPLEALRLNCEAVASDLNPVACLILRAMLEDIPKSNAEIPENLRNAGARIKATVQKELANLYPQDIDGASPVVYLWARTVRCETPNCGAEIPLVRSMWLSKTANVRRALRSRVRRTNNEQPTVDFEIFEPESEKEVENGTVARAKATCLCCRTVLPPERVRAQLTAQCGGTDVAFDSKGNRTGGARLLAVTTTRKGTKRRGHRLANRADYDAVRLAQERIQGEIRNWEDQGRSGRCPIPDEELPLMSGTFNVPLYGIKKWGDLFTARQKAALLEISRYIQESDEPKTIRVLLAFALSKFARANNGNARLRPDSSVAPAFGMQALPITWTFPETVLWGGRSEHFDGAIENISEIVEAFPAIAAGQVAQSDASDYPLPNQSGDVWFTDPPYYFAVPYADLSDFFFVWLKRTLPEETLLKDPYDQNNTLTPKQAELCEMQRWDPRRYAHKNKAFFEQGMGKAFGEGRRVLRDDGVGSVVFAHKTTEGWEALLSGMIEGGWTITGSWPIATEASSRLRARDAAALATSVHLVCRPRPEDAPVGEWADVLRELPIRVGDWMQRLGKEGVKGADLIFACIGPALEIYSRYSRVENT